jgi:hypothetical protein
MMMTVSKHNAALKLLTDGKVPLDVIMDALAAEEAAPEPEEHVHVERHPVAVPITSTERRNLRQIAARVEAYDFPKKPVVLTEEQRRIAITAFNDIKSARKVLERAENAFKAMFHNHLDLLVEKSGDEAPVDEHGHYVTEADVTAEGVSVKVARELRGGKAAPLTIGDLVRLEQDKAISHDDYLLMTTAVRNVDPSKVMLRLQEKPELLAALATVAKLTDKTTAMSVRPVK